jgi:hypothetical protein
VLVGPVRPRHPRIGGQEGPRHDRPRQSLSRRRPRRAPVTAARTDSFLGERYRRLARRRGKKKAIVAVGRSILVIIWHLLSDPEARFHDLGPDLYDTRVGLDRKKRNHVRQLEALGYKITLEPAA